MADQIVLDTPVVADQMNGTWIHPGPPTARVQVAIAPVKSSGWPWYVWLAIAGGVWWMVKD